MNPLDRIPSLGDVLETPQLRGLAERLSKSTVAGVARGVLEEVTAEVRSLANEGTFPDVGELVDRIARRAAIVEQTSPRPVINGTGRLFGGPCGRPPLAEVALDAAREMSKDYLYSGSLDSVPGERVRIVSEKTESLLREFTGAEAGLVTVSLDAARWLMLTALVEGREVLVGRNHMIDDANGVRLHEVIAASGAWAHEVGAVNHTTAADFRSAATDEAALALVISSAACRIDGQTQFASRGEVAKAVHERGLLLAAELRDGTLLDFSPYGLADLPTVAQVLGEGADLVLLPGDTLIGGPRTGIILGRRRAIDALRAHPLFEALRAEPGAQAALAATLHLFRTPDVARTEVPVVQLLTASEDNLQDRAQRLAPQIGEATCVESIDIVEGTADVFGPGSVGPTRPTRRLRIVPHQMSARTLREKLLQPTPGLAVLEENGHITVDLRSVLPRQDMALVAAFSTCGECGGEH